MVLLSDARVARRHQSAAAACRVCHNSCCLSCLTSNTTPTGGCLSCVSQLLLAVVLGGRTVGDCCAVGCGWCTPFVGMGRHKKLQPYDKALRKFDYTTALDEVRVASCWCMRQCRPQCPSAKWCCQPRAVLVVVVVVVVVVAVVVVRRRRRRCRRRRSPSSSFAVVVRPRGMESWRPQGPTSSLALTAYRRLSVRFANGDDHHHHHKVSQCTTLRHQRRPWRHTTLWWS